MKRKLLVINSALRRGSTGHITELIASLARKDGWECCIAHGARFVGNSEVPSFQISGRVEELMHFLTSKCFDRHGLGSVRPTKSLIKHIEYMQPDVVHLHNIHGYYVNHKLLLGYLAEKRIPTVITMHDFWLMTGHCAYINKNCDKWETGCGHCPRLGEYPSALTDHTKKNWEIKRKLFGSFDNDRLVIVPVSHWLERFAKLSLLGGCKITTIQNGIDTKVFSPYEEKHSKLWESIDWSKLTIITVADRWTSANGFDKILQLSNLLPNEMQIVMVGLNEQQMKGLPDKIVGLGHTDNVQQLVELYSSADVLFNASTEVTFGLVTAEAMACGTPAIVFRNTAGEEIVDENTGFVVDDLNEILKVVGLCRENAEQYKKNCRDRIVSCFDSEKQYSKYIELYSDILQNNR